MARNTENTETVAIDFDAMFGEGVDKIPGGSGRGRGDGPSGLKAAEIVAMVTANADRFVKRMTPFMGSLEGLIPNTVSQAFNTRAEREGLDFHTVVRNVDRDGNKSTIVRENRKGDKVEEAGTLWIVKGAKTKRARRTKSEIAAENGTADSTEATEATETAE